MKSSIQFCLTVASALIPLTASAASVSNDCTSQWIFSSGGGDAKAYYASYYFENRGDTKFILKGSFPDARYVGVVTYNVDRPKIYDFLTDREIVPNAGNINPYVDGADIAAKNRAFTVNVVPFGQEIQAPNRVELPDSASVKYTSLWYRIYSANEGVSITQGNLPQILATDLSGKPKACPKSSINGKAIFQAAIAALKQPIAPVPTDDAIVFYRYAAATLFGNPDNLYLMSNLNLSAGNVGIVQFRAPEFFNSRSGKGKFSSATDLRYWSYCATVVGEGMTCLADYEVPVASDGTVRIAYGPIQYQAQAKAASIGYIVTANETKTKFVTVTYRNLVSGQFEGNLSQIAMPTDGSPAPAEPVIGEYAPNGLQCPGSSFATSFCNR